MGKKYVMFVDERGFFSTDVSNNFSMIGIIFECDYCNDLKTKFNQYKKELSNGNNFNIFLDELMVKENISKKINKIKQKEFLSELPLIFKHLKFTVISSVITQDTNNVNDLYDIVSKNLLKSFYSFIMNKNGNCGGIIMEAREKNASFIMQQKFFNIYNERSTSLNMLGDVEEKINTFVVSEKDNKTYGLGIELSNILNNILFRVANGLREIDSKIMLNFEYGNKDKIFNEIKRKMYNDSYIEMSNKSFRKSAYNSIEVFDKELKTLKEQLKLKDTRIHEKEKEIKELTNEIQFLNQQLEESLLSRKSDNVIFKILSEIDFKMKGLEKQVRVAKY